MTALCLLALAAVTPQDAMATPITLQYAAAPTRACVEQLAETAHLKLTVDAELAWEPVIVRVKARPLRKVMDAMADALGGVWVEHDGGWKLNPDQELAKREAAEARAELHAMIGAGLDDSIKSIRTIDWSGPEGKAEIQKEVDKLNKIVESMKADNPNFGAGGSMTIMSGGSSSASPANDLLKSALQSMTVEQLDSIPWDESAVFSNQPTARQKRLTKSLGSALTDFVKAHNALAAAAQDGRKGLPQGINLRSPSLDTKPIEGGVRKVLLQIKRTQTGRGFSITMKIADGAGKIVGSAGTYIGEGQMLAPAEEQPETQAPSDLGLGARASEIVEIDPASRELAAVLSQHANVNGFQRTAVISMGNGGAPARVTFFGEGEKEYALSPQARELAARPDKVDPLSLASGEITAALADELGHDLVAVLPDEAALGVGKILLEGKVAFGRIPTFLKQSGAVAEVKDGVLVIEPASHNEARWSRVNRGALAGLTSDFASKGFVRMMDAAHYASNGHARGGLDRAYINLFTEDWNEPLFGMSSTRRLFRILGHSWSDADLQSQVIDGGSMKTPIRREVEALLYGSEAMTMFGGRGDFVSVMMSAGGGEPPAQPEPSLADEPTERYPNGMPLEAKLNIASLPDKALFIQNRQSGRGTFTRLQELAMRMGMQGPDGPVGPDYKSNEFTYAVAQMNSVQVILEVPEVAGQSEFFKDGKLDTSAPRVGYGQLPADVAEELKRMTEEMGNGRVRFGGPGGNRVPPPSP